MLEEGITSVRRLCYTDGKSIDTEVVAVDSERERLSVREAPEAEVKPFDHAGEALSPADDPILRVLDCLSGPSILSYLLDEELYEKAF